MIRRESGSIGGDESSCAWLVLGTLLKDVCFGGGRLSMFSTLSWPGLLQELCRLAALLKNHVFSWTSVGTARHAVPFPPSFSFLLLTHPFS